MHVSCFPNIIRFFSFFSRFNFIPRALPQKRNLITFRTRDASLVISRCFWITDYTNKIEGERWQVFLSKFKRRICEKIYTVIRLLCLRINGLVLFFGFWWKIAHQKRKIMIANNWPLRTQFAGRETTRLDYSAKREEQVIKAVAGKVTRASFSRESSSTLPDCWSYVFSVL